MNAKKDIKFEILPKCEITGLFAASTIEPKEGQTLWVQANTLEQLFERCQEMIEEDFGIPPPAYNLCFEYKYDFKLPDYAKAFYIGQMKAKLG